MNLELLYHMEMMRKRRIAAGGDTMTPLTLTALTAGSKVTLNKVGSPPAVSLEYSTGGAWSTYTIGTEITLVSAGDYIKFRGNNGTFSTTLTDYYQFVMSGTIGASGNVMSLVDSTCKLLTIPCDFCFIYLFNGCIGLTTAPALPATTLATSCYRSTFQGCTKLSSIEVSFTSWTQATNPTATWVTSVASSGTFTKPAALAEEYGTSRIPTGWTVVNK